MPSDNPPNPPTPPKFQDGPQSPGKPTRYTGLLGIIDRYFYVDQMRVTRADLLPVMRWWEWIWFLVINVAFVIGFQWLDDWISDQIKPVPVLNWIPWIITWPVIGLIWLVLAHLLLPAREARKKVKNGEALILTAIWLAVLAVQQVISWF